MKKSFLLSIVLFFLAPIITSFPIAFAQDILFQKDRIAKNPSPFIIGGTPVQQGDLSFQVTVNSRFFCGGAIIADSWVMTAAHCVDLDSASQISVRAGVYQLNSNQGQTFSVIERIIHPDWTNNLQQGNDIALLRIDGVFPSNLERLKLPTPAVVSALAQPGQLATVSGWGRTSSNSGLSNDLLMVDMRILSDFECEQLQGNFNTPAIICGLGPGVASSCNGDSGGPFFVGSGSEHFSIGIVSFGPVGCEGYSAYTETLHFVDWITQHVDIDGGGTETQELENNRPVSVSGQQGERKFFTFELSAGVTNADVRISGGSGDADLYVRKDDLPTDREFDCRPFLTGNQETCTLTNPVAGRYFVMVKGFTSFNDVTLILSHNDDSDSTPVLDNNSPVSVSGLMDERQFFAFDLPAGVNFATVSISGGAGDADLYVRKDIAPTDQEFDCRPFIDGNEETCTLTNPESGQYFVMVKGFRDFSSVTLLLSF